MLEFDKITSATWAFKFHIWGLAVVYPCFPLFLPLNTGRMLNLFSRNIDSKKGKKIKKIN